MKNKKLYYLIYGILIIYLPLINSIINHQKKLTLISLSIFIYYFIFYKILFDRRSESSLLSKINLPNKFWIFLIFITTYIFQNQYLQYEQITWDVPSYLVASLDVSLGNLPFQTQWESKGPLLIYIYFFLSEISQHNYVYFKLLNDIFIFIASLLIFYIFSKFYKKSFTGLVASIIFLITTSHEWFVSEFSEIYCMPLLGLAYIVFKKNEKKHIDYFLIGTLISLTTLINQGTLIFAIPYFLIFYYELRFIKKIKYIYFYILGLVIPHIIFIILYFKSGLLDVYLANYITIPLAYSGGNAASVYELSVVLRRFFQYNQFLYYSIITLLFFAFIDIFSSLKQNNLKFLLKIEYLNFLFAVLFYFIAGHGYAHHLFYIIFFGSFLILFINKEQKNIISTFAIIALISLGINVLPKSLNNLSNLEEIYANYPLRQLSERIKENVSDNIEILALDYVLVLYYLNIPNESYIVHPGNHYEEYIVNTFEKLNKVSSNQYSHISFLIEQEPDVILCNPTDIISGQAVRRDFYNCAIDDYKKNYKKLDTEKIKNNPNLSLYNNPYESINVYIKIQEDQ